LEKRMFSFVTKTWNPLEGECLHDCCYCYVNTLKQRFPKLEEKYSGDVRLNRKVLINLGKIADAQIIFACSCNDLFGQWVPDEHIEDVMDVVKYLGVPFLFLTKNPLRYRGYVLDNFKDIFGATIESDLEDDESKGLSVSSPETMSRKHRLVAMKCLREVFPKNLQLMISIEPIIRFSSDFAQKIIECKPTFVAVGYNNNRAVKLDEPSLADTEELICQLEAAGVMVFRKTLREATA